MGATARAISTAGVSGAERDAGRAVDDGSSDSTISMPAALLRREGRQQDARRLAVGLGRRDGVAQHALDLLGVEVLLEHRELAADPRVADGHQRTDRVGHEPLESLAHQHLAEPLPELGELVGADQVEDPFDLVVVAGAARGRSRECVEVDGRHPGYLAGRKPRR